MENIGRAIVDGAIIVARQATSLGPVPTSSIAPASTSSVSDAVTSAITEGAAEPTPSGNPGGGGGGGGGGSNSPLLFFVALGFGVVFTNLWIIVGVKYCFRYNARNRALARGVDENGEPIDLQNMPARPHRRRREKKLMTMEEVNEKFPMVKYKTWVLDRKKEGLPTTGGISAPPSRANSVRSVNGIIPEQSSESRVSVDEATSNTPRGPDGIVQSGPKPTDKDEQKSIDKSSNVTLPTADDKDATVTNDAPGATPVQTETTAAKDSLRRTSEDEDEDDEDDHVNHALDADMMGSSGDTCAICIDTLEDDDDVRGLTCGHAFHAVCLDPWLTNRRACCPLCKADYYTPKVRPPPPEGETRDPNAPEAPPDPARNNARLNYPRAPVRSFAWSHFRDAPRQMFPSRFQDTPRDPGQADRHYRSRQQPGQPRRQAPQPVLPEETGGNPVTRFRNRFPPFVLDRVMRRNRAAEAADLPSGGANSSVAPAPTPSQLEAGVRPADTRPN